MPRAVDALEQLRTCNDALPASQLDELSEAISSLRTPILESLAEAVVSLQPDRPSSEPDLFGQSFFTLIHHTEQAIACGDADLLARVFPRVLAASMVLHEHVLSTYSQDSDDFNPALLDPVIDLLEVSGLALIYEVLRNDGSADPVRNAWTSYVMSSNQPQDVAKKVLTLLDLSHAALPFGMTPRGTARMEWEQRLTDQIVDAGYARPAYTPFADRPQWSAPRLVKLIGVTGTLPRVSHHPRVIFAAEVIAPLSGESNAELRAVRRLITTLKRGTSLTTSQIPVESSWQKLRCPGSPKESDRRSRSFDAVPTKWTSSEQTDLLYQDFHNQVVPYRNGSISL